MINWDNKPKRFAEFFDQFSDYPKGIIIKIACMVYGTHFTDAVFKSPEISQANTARFYIFSFDIEETNAAAPIPTYFRLKNIDNHHYGPVVQVRPNSNSPYFFDVVNGKVMLCEQFPGDKELTPVVDIEFDPKPDFNNQVNSNGEPLTTIGSLIYWKEFFYSAVQRACQYWHDGLQCKFCDINSLVADLRKQGIKHPAIKTPEQVLEAVEAAIQSSKNMQYIFLSGGAVIKPINGLDPMDWFRRFPETINNKLARRYTIHAQTVALPYEKAKLLHQAGVDVHEANLEVWDPKLFPWVCPAKDKYVGRDEWIKRLIKSVEVFGVGNVVPVFVQGVEMAQPYGFKEVDAAVESTLKGWDFLMDHGVTPRFDIWGLEKGSTFYETQKGIYPPPMEYFLKTTRGAYDLEKTHGLPNGHGYPGGRAGYGECMFGQTAQWDFDDSVR